MTKTIAELWKGELKPVEYSGINNLQIKQLARLVEDNCENFEANLNEKQQEIFEKYNHSFEDYSFLTNEQAFCDGFCLGMKIAAEALIGAEKII
ncbi:MAG: hypothetical protein J1E56_06295 [Ruminococcus sp.]|nr:hypothetical protein [Ruminococcus sp.]